MAINLIQCYLGREATFMMRATCWHDTEQVHVQRTSRLSGALGTAAALALVPAVALGGAMRTSTTPPLMPSSVCGLGNSVFTPASDGQARDATVIDQVVEQWAMRARARPAVPGSRAVVCLLPWTPQ